MASMIRTIRRNNEARIAKNKWGLSRSKYFKEKRRQMHEQLKILTDTKAKKRDVKRAAVKFRQIKMGNLDMES